MADGIYKFNDVTNTYEVHTALSAYGPKGMDVIEVDIPVYTILGTLAGDINVCQTYPVLRGRLGNTFVMPDPFDPHLDPDIFDGAAYYVEVRFEDGSTDKGLIAVPSFAGSLELRFYSFNIAIDRRPIEINLYHFTKDAYPNLSSQTSEK
eukprot:10619221-Ditylum_brightwellii.AAC.1